MAFSLVNSLATALGQNGGTTSTLDTTGADLIVVALAYFDDEVAPTLSDNKSNTYTGLTEAAAVGDGNVRLFYVENAAAGSGHTWTVSGTNVYVTIAVQAWSGSKTSAAAFDQQNTGSNTGTTVQPGSVLPGEDNELIVTAMCNNTDTGTGRTINSSFTISGQVGYTGAVNFPIGFAYLVQTSLASVNPTWSWTGSQATNAAIATFKAAGAATGQPTIKRWAGVPFMRIGGTTFGNGGTW